jgi:hypothetical protein
MSDDEFFDSLSAQTKCFLIGAGCSIISKELTEHPDRMMNIPQEMREDMRRVIEFTARKRPEVRSSFN